MQATTAASDTEIGAIFAALADPTRRHLVRSLAAEPGTTATKLAATLPITRQAVSKHLQMLGRAGLISTHRRGREARFELETAPLADAVAWLGAVGADWDGKLANLQRLLGR